MNNASFLNIDFDRLKIFYLVVRERSFTKAASILKIDKSSASRQLQLLEEELQTRLIIRDRKELKLTTAGEFVFEKAQKVLEELRSIQGYLNSRESEPLQGLLRLNTTHALSATWLTSFIGKFADAYPALHLEIIASNQPVDLITGEFDAAIRPFLENSTQLTQEFLMRWRLHLYASKLYIERFGLPTTAQELDHHRLIVFGDPTAPLPRSYTSMPLYLGTEKGHVRKPFIMLNSVPGIYNLVAAGVGIGCFAKDSPTFKQYDFVPVLPHLPSTEVEVYYIYPESTKFFPKIRLFGDFLKKEAQAGNSDAIQ